MDWRSGLVLLFALCVIAFDLLDRVRLRQHSLSSGGGQRTGASFERGWRVTRPPLPRQSLQPLAAEQTSPADAAEVWGDSSLPPGYTVTKVTNKP